MHIIVKNRFAAFGIHLAISFVLFLFLAAVIRFFWYPGVLFSTEGGWEGIKLIAGVDLVIGPTLTLMVYNITKPELKRDLAIIGILQVACIVGGMATVAYSRPIAVIYSEDTFYVTTRQRYEGRDIDIDKINLLKQSKPVWISIKIPGSETEKLNMLDIWKQYGGIDVATERYQPYEMGVALLSKHGISISDFAKSDKSIKPKLLTSSSARVFTLVTRYGFYWIAVDTATGEILALLGEQQITH